jgi:NADH dehydrogenase
MMILVTGGAGVMGSRLVRELVKAGNRVRVLTLPKDPNVSRIDGLDCEILYGDVSDADSLKGVFEGVTTVYHLAAIIIAYDSGLFQKINVDGTKNMVEGAASAGAKHFVYVSSASAISPNASPYARSKMEADCIVTSQEKMSFTIVRPTLVYDRNGGQEFMMFMDYLKKYPVVPFIGRGRAKKNPVFVDDFVQGMLAIANNPKTYGKIYNFSGGEEVSMWDLAHLMLKNQGLSKLFIPIPIPICRLLAFIMEKTVKHPPLTGYGISRIVQDANLDHSAATEDIGYNPVSIREGLLKCYPV